MAKKNNAMLPQLKALKTTDISPLIRMAGAMLPRALKAFVVSLDEKQKAAFDRVMPEDGKNRIYLQLLDSPTPPIVIRLAQPIKMGTLSESKVKEKEIRGIRLTTDDLQVLAEGQTLGNMLRFTWRLKGQLLTLLGMMPIAWPFIRLGPAKLRDFIDKMLKHFKPLLDLLPGSK